MNAHAPLARAACFGAPMRSWRRRVPAARGPARVVQGGALWTARGPARASRPASGPAAAIEPRR